MACFKLESRRGLVGARYLCDSFLPGRARSFESASNNNNINRWLSVISRCTCSHSLASCSGGGAGGDGNGNGKRRQVSDRFEGDDNDGTSGLRGGLVSSAVFAAAFFLLQSECSASAKDKTPPKSVSIVIPVFNEASCIEALLEFLQLLDPSPLEIIVVDGGSTDETVRLISKLSKKKKMKNVALWKTRLGSRSKQMNFGARKSKGDYIMFLHADTVPPLDTVSILRNAFARSPKAHLAGFTAIMDHRDRTFWSMSLIHAIKTHLGPLIYRPSYFARGVKVFFGDQAMVAERKAFDAVGGFNESLNIMEDLDLCVKVFLGIRPDPRDENKCTSISSKEGRSWGSGSGSRFVSIDRCVHTSGRRVAEWGSWNSLKLFLVLSTSYCYGASPSSLNELGNKVYTAIR